MSIIAENLNRIKPSPTMAVTGLARDLKAAGADVIQLYTGMIYRGPGIAKEIKKELISILKNEKIRNISEAVGIKA